MKLLKQKRFQYLFWFLLGTAISLFLLLGYGFWMTAHQKQHEYISLVTTSGDSSVMEHITLSGAIWKTGYESRFSVTNAEVTSQVETLSTKPPSYWRYGSRFFTYDLDTPTLGFSAAELEYLLSENSEQILLRTEREQEREGWVDAVLEEDGLEVWIVKNYYQPERITPVFSILSADAIRSGFYSESTPIMADYTVATNSNTHYVHEQVTYNNNIEDMGDLHWEEVQSMSPPTFTNFMQLSATIDEHTYLTLPTIEGATGENGIYRFTPTNDTSYYRGWEPRDLSDPDTKAEYTAQREPVYLYPIQSEGESDRLTCAMMDFENTLFLLTAQQSTQTMPRTMEPLYALTLTVIDPLQGTVLDTLSLGTHDLLDTTATMFYRNEQYLSLAVTGKDDYKVFTFDLNGDGSIQQTANSGTTPQSGDTGTNGLLQIVNCTTFTFEKQDPSFESCLLDVYFDGSTLYVIESTQNLIGTDAKIATMDASCLTNENSHRILAMQDNLCVWEGALHTDVYQDYLRDYSYWSDTRKVSDLKFHKTGEVRK